MALRDKLRDRTQPLLNPDETIEQIFLARGASPWIYLMFGPFALIGVVLLMAKKLLAFRVVARTDQSLVILDGGFSGTNPQRILKRLPRNTTIGPLKGIWARTVIDGDKIWIHKKFQKDAVAQDVTEAA